MGVTDELGRGQGTQATFTFSLFGLLLLAIMSAGLGTTQAFPKLVSAARPLRYTLPTFLDTPVNVTAVFGSDVILPCSIQNLGPKSVIWRKVTQANPISIGEYVFDPDESYEVIRGGDTRHAHHNRGGKWRLSHEDPRWDLLIRSVEFEHAGTYECQVSTKEDFGRNVTLRVIEDKTVGRTHHRHNKTGIQLSGTLYVEKGSTIDLNCTATSIDYRPKGVDWFKDGSKVKSGHRVVFTDYVLTAENVLHSRLQIDHSTMDDAGTYVCRFSARHVQSVKVIVLNKWPGHLASANQLADSPNKRRDDGQATLPIKRGTGSEGLEGTNNKYPSKENSALSSKRAGSNYTVLILLLTLAAVMRS